MRRQLLLALTLLVLSTALLGAVSFTTAPTITPDGLRAPTTQDELTCAWQPSPDTWEENATWYNGSTPYSTTINDSDGQVTLPAGTARKNEVWTCNVTLTNSTGSTTHQAAQVTIKNAAPTPPNATDETLYEDHPRTITLHSTDPDDDSLTYHMEDGVPTYCSMAQATGTLTCSPQEEDIGAQNATFYVKDGGFDWPNTNVTYTVLEVNDAPQTSLSDQEATEGETFSYDITVTDEEEHWPISFALETSLESINITSTGNNTATITFTNPGNAPTASDTGYWEVQVNITDSGPSAATPYDDPTGTASFYLNVSSTNKAPVITTNFTGYPPMASQGDAYEFTINATDNDTTDTIAFSITSNCSLDNPWSITTTNSTATNATAKVNTTQLTNEHVVCRWANITATDGEAYTWQVVLINITNTNDDPLLHENSAHAQNTPIQGVNNNTNMSGLTAVKGSPFVYRLNATDPDSDTYEGEVLAYSDNSTNNISVEAASGIINFTPTEAEVGNHTINITVTDDEGASSSRTLRIEVRNNSEPRLQPIGDVACDEDEECTRYLDALDPDPAEDLVFTSNNTAIFPVQDHNETSWKLNITPTNDQVGTYPITITVTDKYGFTDSEAFNFTINNTNDAPIFDSDGDGTADNITFPVVVVDHLFIKRINVTDEDLDIGLDNLSYNFSYTADPGNLEAETSIIASGPDHFTISFLPSAGHIGNYTINVSATDLSGATAWQEVNFTVHPKSSTPIIEEVRPHWNDTTNTTLFTFGNASAYATSTINVNTTENTTIIFDALATNDSLVAGNRLTYYWYVGGELAATKNNAAPGTNSSHPLPLGFFSAGNTSVRVIIEDERYSRANWTWNLEVADVNRPPAFYHEMPNITVNRSSSYSDFMSHFTNALGWQQLFYDADDDTDSDGERGMGTAEPTNLTYTIAPGYGCSLATITFSQDTLNINPSQEGTCLVTFRATDPYGAYADSNIVRITITAIEVQEVETPISSGGGQSRPRNVPYPFEVPIESPHPIELVTPGEVVTYADESVEVPLTIRNTWEETLQGITLNATVENETFTPTFSFSTDYFPTLAPDEEYDITLTIEDYRQDEPFNVVVAARVADPEYVDSAVVMINAMERRNDGQDVESKVTFARDLLNDNPECQELNELITKAEEERLNGNPQEALRLINSAVNGCKYLINEQEPATEEHPKSFFAVMTLSPKQLPAIIVGAAIIVILLVFGILMLFSGKRIDI